VTVYLNRRVPLANRRGYALVHTMDYELVMQYRWFLMRGKRTDYAKRNIKRPDGAWTTQRMHQLISGRKNMDHANLNNGLDNRRSNLRPASGSQQQAHQRKRKDNTSGYVGVSWDESHGKWIAQVKKDGKYVWQARFDDLEEAARARDAKALEVFGEFAVLNFP
jgi:AP2 domain